MYFPSECSIGPIWGRIPSPFIIIVFIYQLTNRNHDKLARRTEQQGLARASAATNSAKQSRQPQPGRDLHCTQSIPDIFTKTPSRRPTATDDKAKQRSFYEGAGYSLYAQVTEHRKVLRTGYGHVRNIWETTKIPVDIIPGTKCRSSQDKISQLADI